MIPRNNPAKFQKYPMEVKNLYLMKLRVDQANSGAKYQFGYVFMVKVKFLKSNFRN